MTSIKWEKGQHENLPGTWVKHEYRPGTWVNYASDVCQPNQDMSHGLGTLLFSSTVLYIPQTLVQSSSDIRCQSIRYQTDFSGNQNKAVCRETQRNSLTEPETFVRPGVSVS